MPYQRIQYANLNAKQKEIFNFQKLSGVLADYGYNCIKLADDWNGADFLAYRNGGHETLRVQLKSALTIKQDYLQHGDLYIAFPHRLANQEINSRDWYLIKHSELVEKVRIHTPWLNSDSWLIDKSYHSQSPSVALMESLIDFKLE